MSISPAALNMAYQFQQFAANYDASVNDRNFLQTTGPKGHTTVDFTKFHQGKPDFETNRQVRQTLIDVINGLYRQDDGTVNIPTAVVKALKLGYFKSGMKLNDNGELVMSKARPLSERRIASIFNAVKLNDLLEANSKLSNGGFTMEVKNPANLHNYVLKELDGIFSKKSIEDAIQSGIKQIKGDQRREWKYSINGEQIKTSNNDKNDTVVVDAIKNKFFSDMGDDKSAKTAYAKLLIFANQIGGGMLSPTSMSDDSLEHKTIMEQMQSSPLGLSVVSPSITGKQVHEVDIKANPDNKNEILATLRFDGGASKLVDGDGYFHLLNTLDPNCGSHSQITLAFDKTTGNVSVKESEFKITTAKQLNTMEEAREVVSAHIDRLIANEDGVLDKMYSELKKDFNFSRDSYNLQYHINNYKKEFTDFVMDAIKNERGKYNDYTVGIPMPKAEGTQGTLHTLPIILNNFLKNYPVPDVKISSKLESQLGKPYISKESLIRAGNIIVDTIQQDKEQNKIEEQVFRDMVGQYKYTVNGKVFNVSSDQTFSGSKDYKVMDGLNSILREKKVKVNNAEVTVSEKAKLKMLQICHQGLNAILYRGFDENSENAGKGSMGGKVLVEDWDTKPKEDNNINISFISENKFEVQFFTSKQGGLKQLIDMVNPNESINLEPTNKDIFIKREFNFTVDVSGDEPKVEFIGEQKLDTNIFKFIEEQKLNTNIV